ncbi:GATA transcription factor 28-like [Impatiens glandulifera]|uniref:GATA transcription factor 28-like n=1 Tax=Impatiens glandulifera TaxID=253017 RepID=UPI001FB0663D|nr:GATA transcription factor 28-like [Impatiens glandulifera]
MQETDIQHSMYATDSMDVQEHQHQQESQIEDEGGDDVAGGESIDNPHIRFDSHSIHDGGDVVVPMNDNAHNSHVLYSTGTEVPLAVGGSSVDQLTLSFQGEVYVFDAVTPEKVQAVLLLLGGYEVPTGTPTIGATSQNPRALDDFPCRSSQPQRAASLNRFREKRKERCFDKKIRYTVRKEVALRMQRKKGQFTSSKSISDEGTSDGDGTQGGLLQTTAHEEQETLCSNCGVNSKSTPMMRRGPAGPRTLCNACGLKWANKGVLKDLSKVLLSGGGGGGGNIHMNNNNNIKAKEQNVVEGNNSDIITVVSAPPSNNNMGKNHPQQL